MQKAWGRLAADPVKWLIGAVYGVLLVSAVSSSATKFALRYFQFEPVQPSGVSLGSVEQRDARRKADLAMINAALESYAKARGTYVVQGTNAAGFVNHPHDSLSIVQALHKDGFLAVDDVDDPDPAKRFNYMLYVCDNGSRYALSATLENPSAEDIANIQVSCNGVGKEGTYTRYRKNYAIGTAGVKLGSLDERDARRKSDLAMIKAALESYAKARGTYVVAGTQGAGFVNHPHNGVSIVQALHKDGFLAVDNVDDPDPAKRFNYMLYVCEDGARYALSATLEDPSAEDIANIQTSCNGVGEEGTYTRYRKNYAVGTAVVKLGTLDERDARRKADLAMIKAALESYAKARGTYVVEGTQGAGFVNHPHNGVSIVQALHKDGFLAVDNVDDPDPAKRFNYMLYVCDNGARYAVSATLEDPSAEDIANIQTSCNGVGEEGTYTRYRKNYAVGTAVVKLGTLDERDARRKADLAMIKAALESYAKARGTYVVAGTHGAGFVNHPHDGVSIVQALHKEGFLAVDNVDDPDPAKRFNYMLYVCDNGTRYALSATLEDPSAEDIANIQTSCNGVGEEGTYTRYRKNYAVGEAGPIGATGARCFTLPSQTERTKCS